MPNGKVGYYTVIFAKMKMTLKLHGPHNPVSGDCRVIGNSGTGQALIQQKVRLRERLKQIRRTLEQKQRLEFDQVIHKRLLEQVEQADPVFCYVSAGDEVATRPVIDRLRQLDKTVLIPKIVNKEKMIGVRFDGWKKLRVGQLGILAPESDSEWQTGVNLCIMPGLGFTLDGARIGFGKGYYDKWLAAHPDTATMALCYECQIIDYIPTTETDVRVKKIITEKRVLHCH